jgi:hypothetical protein
VPDPAACEAQAQRLLTADDAALRLEQDQPVTAGIAAHPPISVVIHIHRVTLDAMIMYEK